MMVSMAQKLEMEHDLIVDTSVRVSSDFLQTSHSNATGLKKEIVMNVSEKGHSLEIICREIDDYWVKRHNKYEVDVLYAVTNKNSIGGM